MEQLAEVDPDAKFAFRVGIKFKHRRFYVVICGGTVGFGTR